MLFTYLLVLLAAFDLSFARLSRRAPGGSSNKVVKHGHFPTGLPGGSKTYRNRRRASLAQRQASSATGCGASGQLTVKAPSSNIFASLSDDDAASVITFLHAQPSLNLTAAATATSWDNKIQQVELLQPNKSDALSYLDSGSAAPKQYVRAVIRFGATPEPYIQEYQVGPLPVTNGSTSLTELNYIYNKGRGYQRLYDLDFEALLPFVYGVTGGVADITKLLINGTATGAPDDTLTVSGNTPLIHEDDKIFQWNQFYPLHTGACIDEELLPTGLQFKADITGRDPAGWSVVAWYYNGIFYESELAFRSAINSTGFVNVGPNVDGDWACTDYNNDPFPHDELSPPVPVQPDGPRFSVDVQEKYVEWMDFSFYLSSNKDLGVQLHDVRYKGERIIYELGLQEALAHYASASDPFQAYNAYLDSQYGFGQSSFQLVSGFDCPAYASFLNTSYHSGETSHTHPNSICMFEFDTAYPVQRHTTPTYVSVTKNIAFIIRHAATVGNYDYLFDYEFYLDGSIHITVRASGYIQSSFYTTNFPASDGFHIHDHLAGSMHEHVLNYKLDLDVAGTKNSLMRTALVPATETYPWSNGKARNTMKLDRSFITSENDGKLNWDANNAVFYSIVNKDQPNQYGEYRGYKIMRGTGNNNYLVIQNSTTLGPSVNWADHHLYAVQRKDNEPQSAHPYNGRDPTVPLVDFAKFFDGDSLDQEDIVVYFNLGMHHIPDTSDIPNTVFTSAHSSFIVAPQNYLLSDPSRGTIHQTRINVINGSVTDALTFGAKQPTCALDLSQTAPDTQTFIGEVYINKFPYHSDAQMIGNPFDGLEPSDLL
ncbi:uncharacterized protein KY384_002695 [Bacidia gigantensis]|uniref:uncharacterized protein n=1 Tax=Bacidia gigantensis TaxID=2732470 RepID=UPI001D059DF3|nr:uncharacterized protein KY384_002695 [Bacidia gigantensis]KAG8532817.1 hypothetical protein KY384_002695 [Bacidia gigantensis]